MLENYGNLDLDLFRSVLRLRQYGTDRNRSNLDLSDAHDF